MMTSSELHPAINAVLNGASVICLIIGYVAIRRGKRERHKKFMVGAFVASTLFLVSYLVRFYTSGTHRYPGDGAD